MTTTVPTPQAAQKPNRTVFDTHGNAYELTKKLGEGGQGMVFTTSQPRVLVKLPRDTKPESQREWLEHVRWIRRQDLKNLKLLLPMAIIEKPRYGYLMEMLDDLEPLTAVFERCHNAVLESRGLDEYSVSGGLKRRYRLLAQLARTLAELHGRGLVFGDLAPSNIFVSRTVDHAEVWLIDCDNLSPLSRVSKQHVFTPGYGAPEVVRGESGTHSLTDSWSFAVLAFELLVMAHPLHGDVVEQSEPEVQEAAHRGEWPWIDHPSDRRNSLSESRGLPRWAALTSRLRQLFSDCFENGMAEPGARPGMAAWAEAFEWAERNTVHCTAPRCQQSFLYTDALQCSFCDAPRSEKQTLLLKHSLFVPGLDAECARLRLSADAVVTPPDLDDEVTTAEIIVLEKGETLILRKAPFGSADYANSEEQCSLTLRDDGLVLKCPAQVYASIERKGSKGSQKPILLLSNQEKPMNNILRVGDTWILRVGDVSKPHDGWLFTW